jgi:hypothetical protein
MMPSTPAQVTHRQARRAPRLILTFMNKSVLCHCLYVAIAAILFLGVGPAQAAGTDPDRELLRERMLLESMVAMLEPGTKVCREVRWGIGQRERVEGMSLGVRQDNRRVIVQVTRLGQGPFVRDGREVKVGENIEENPLDWVPCR